MVTSSVVAVYLLLNFYFFVLNARENDSEKDQCNKLGDFDGDDSVS